MTQNTVLNNYLNRLEKSLGQISVSDRAEIILEIKSHIDDAQAAGNDLNEILNALGEPETVANRYLLERGLQTQKTPKHPIVKWLTVGFLGTFGIVCLSVIVLIWSFSPLIKVDEKEGRVQILGGLIDVQKKGGKVKIGDTRVEYDKDSHEFKGSMPLKPSKTLSMNFSNAQVQVKTSVDEFFRWDCELDDESRHKPNITTLDKEIVFDLANVMGAQCEVEIPSNVHTRLRGANGRVMLDKPSFGVDVEITNGLVNFELEKSQEYIFEFDVTNGSKPENLNSQKTAKALLMRAKLINGNIEVEGL